MKKKTFALDRVLAEIVQRPKFSTFTISTLRIEYQRSVAADSPKTSSEIRRYVYKQVGRLQKLDWITKHGEPNSRNATYVRGESPSGTVLKLVEPIFSGKAVSKTGAESVNGSNELSLAVAPYQCLPDIEARLNKVRMEFIAKVGEAETFQSLLSEHPALRDKLEMSYLESRNESSSLMGQLRALERTIKVLEPQQ